VWVAYWQARSDLVKKGYAPGAKKLWEGTEPSDIIKLEIAAQCDDLQSAMLIWSRERDAGGKLFPLVTVSNLIHKYQNDDDSAFHKKRYEARQGKAALLKRIDKRFGDVMLAEITGRMILSWYKEWSDGGQKVSAGGAFIATLRTLFRFGAGLLDDAECSRLAGTLSSQSYKGTKPREVALSAEQATAIRKAAHARGWPYMALAQAIQFECTLRQRDVIGEWVPVKEPGVSDVIQTKIVQGREEDQEVDHRPALGADRRKPDPAARHQQAEQEDRDRPEAGTDGDGGIPDHFRVNRPRGHAGVGPGDHLRVRQGIPITIPSSAASGGRWRPRPASRRRQEHGYQERRDHRGRGCRRRHGEGSEGCDPQ
jgi:hypothetical protein